MNGQEELAVFVKDVQKVGGSGPCTVFIVFVFQSAWTTLSTLSQQSS